MAFSGGFGVTAAQGATNPNNDFQVANPPSDGISSLSWSPTANFLVSTSWDCEVYCYDVQANGQAVPKASIKHDKPALCSAWMHDGSAVFSGGCDNMVKKWDLATNTPTQIAAHDLPIRHLAWIPEVRLRSVLFSRSFLFDPIRSDPNRSESIGRSSRPSPIDPVAANVTKPLFLTLTIVIRPREPQVGLLVTGSWDKTLKYWDARQPTPTLQVQLPERCYALSCTHPLLVVGCAERHLQIFNLSNPQTPYRSIQSPLKYQTRCVATFPDKSGYLIGSIEGRVAVNHVEDSLASKNFTFKCHREQADIYAVNSISFHPRHGTFVTTGSDGVFNFWDKDSKQRLKQMQKCNAPIPCGAFNRDGSIFAYAVSYDWSKGGQDPMASAQGGNNIFLHATEETEVKPRPPANRVGGRR